MNKLEKFLKGYHVIGLDAQIFIYLFENNPRFKPVTIALFSLMEQGEIIGVTSILSLLEILTKPMEKQEHHLINEYKFLLNTFPNLIIGKIDEEIIDLAASFKANYSFLDDTFAIQLATAKLYDAECFITHNQSLKKMREIKIINIAEILEKVED
ncbi:MAG: PIN domain-containing protein [bacterium]